MAKLKYSMMNDDWLVERDESSFTSPLHKDRPGQMVIFGERIRNGSISADITLLETANRQGGTPALEACLIARYSGEESYYYAGTGAFSTKFFLGKTLPGHFWQMRAYLGQ